jgi:hypothetical protein
VDQAAAAAVADMRRRARKGISAHTLAKMADARARLTILRNIIAEERPELSFDLDALNAVLTLLQERGIPNWNPLALSASANKRFHRWDNEADKLRGLDFSDVGGPPAKETEPEAVDDAEAMPLPLFIYR